MFDVECSMLNVGCSMFAYPSVPMSTGTAVVGHFWWDEATDEPARGDARPTEIANWPTTRNMSRLTSAATII